MGIKTQQLSTQIVPIEKYQIANTHSKGESGQQVSEQANTFGSLMDTSHWR